MSNTPLGHGWWLATNGKYYPPEQHPEYVVIDELEPTVQLSPPPGPPINDTLYEASPEATFHGPQTWTPPPLPSERRAQQSLTENAQETPAQLGVSGSGFKVVKQRRQRPKSTLALVTGVALLTVLVAVGVFIFNQLGSNDQASRDVRDQADTVASTMPDETEIEAAARRCGLSLSVGDNGTSISLDTQGEDEYSGDDWEDVICLLDDLEVPDRVVSRMDQTRALDGTLDASWGDYEAFWNYHPDHGMNLTIYDSE